MISPLAPTPPSANHHHSTIPAIPVAPEADAAAALDTTAAVGLVEPGSRPILTSVRDATATATPVTRPTGTSSEASKAADLCAERLSAEAVAGCSQQSRVGAVITASDLELATIN